METIKGFITSATKNLAQVSETPRLEAEIILAQVLEKPRTYLIAHPEEILTPAISKQGELLCKRRCQGEPMAYLCGEQEFYSLSFLVSPHTLIPRPDTELIVDLVLKLFDVQKPLNIADLGTGSGAIAIALAKNAPRWRIAATDVSESALAIARKNAQRLEIHQVDFYLGNWCTALPAMRFNALVANPPYLSAADWEEYGIGLSYEPRDALVSGHDGLQAINAIVSQAHTYLDVGGALLIEHGYRQGQAVRALFKAHGLQRVTTENDAAGHERVTLGWL